jgi:hypothetical protein
MNLSDYIDLLPDVYDKGSAPKSNIRKLFEVTADALQIIIDTANENKLIKDLFHASGAVLDAIGEDYGLPRYGKNDDDYRALILAKIFARISGNSDDKIINFFRFFTTLPINVVRLTEDSIRIPKLLGLYVWRAFSVEIPGLSSTLRDRLLPALQILKPAGVYGTINFSQIFNPGTDLPGINWDTSLPVPGKKYVNATQSSGSLRVVDAIESKPSTGAVSSASSFPVTLGVTSAQRDYAIDTLKNGSAYVISIYQRNLAVTPDNKTFVSTDGGLTWASEPAHPNSKFSRLLYASGTRRIAHLFNNNQMSWSNNNGGTWTDVNLPFANTILTWYQKGVALTQEDTPITTIGPMMFIPARTGSILVAARLYLLRSIDNGQTWAGITLSASTLDVVTTIAGSSVTGVILAPANSGMYRSTDYGVTFTFASWGSLGLSQTGGQWIIKQLAVTTYILCKRDAGAAIYVRTTNSGLSYTELSIPGVAPGDQISEMEFVGGVIFVSIRATSPTSNDKVFRSDDLGLTFYKVFEDTGSSFTKFAGVAAYASQYLFSAPMYSTMYRHMPAGTRFVNEDTWLICEHPYLSSTAFNGAHGPGEILHLGLNVPPAPSATAGVSITRYPITFATESGNAILEVNSLHDAFSEKNLMQNDWFGIFRHDNEIMASSRERHGTIAYSPDAGASWYAARWPQQDSRFKQLSGVIKFRGRWYSFGLRETGGPLNTWIAHSDNGYDWYPTVAFSTSARMYYCAVNSTVMVFANNGGSVIGRYDGVNPPAQVTVGLNIFGIGVVTEKFIAGGKNATGNAAYFVSADNGATWNMVDTGIPFTPISFAVSEGGLLVWINASGDVLWGSMGGSFTLYTGKLPVKDWRTCVGHVNNFAAFSTDGPPSFASSRIHWPT